MEIDFKQKKTEKYSQSFKVSATGFEPVTVCLEGRCSIQLSYAPISGIFNSLLGIMNFLKKRKLSEEFSIKSGRQDSNLRPPGPKPGAMTGLRYAPNNFWWMLRRVRDSNPWYSFPYACLANKSFRPLRQLSIAIFIRASVL